MSFFRLIFIIILVFLYPSITFSQHNTAKQPKLKIDNRHYALSEDQAKDIYSSKFFDSFDYLEGKQYQPYNIFGHSTPFLDGEPGTGTIFSNGKAYSKLALRYDIYLDLLINTPELVSYGSLYVTINKTSIDSFSISINSHTYNLKLLHFTENSNTLMKDGFYEVHPCGKSLFLVKHRAVTSKLDGYTEYKYAPIKYVLKDENYSRINSRGDLLKLYPKNHKVVKKRIKSYITPYRKLEDHQIIEILKFAESL